MLTRQSLQTIYQRKTQIRQKKTRPVTERVNVIQYIRLILCRFLENTCQKERDKCFHGQKDGKIRVIIYFRSKRFFSRASYVRAYLQRW